MTAISNYGSSTDPSTGGTWGADQVGAYWYDRTNEVGAGGDDLGAQLKRFEKTGVTPTYQFRDVGARAYFPLSILTTALSVTGHSTTAFDDLDMTSLTSDRTLAVRLAVEVNESNPAAGINIKLRKNGVTTDEVTLSVYPQVAGLTIQQMVDVELDANGILEWSANCSGVSSMAAIISIIGYFERG